MSFTTCGWARLGLGLGLGLGSAAPSHTNTHAPLLPPLFSLLSCLPVEAQTLPNPSVTTPLRSVVPRVGNGGGITGSGDDGGGGGR